MLRRFLIISFSSVLIIFLLAAAISVFYYYQINTPPPGMPKSMLITVENGWGSYRTGVELHRKGLIRSYQSFILAYRFMRKGATLKAGEYEILGGATPLNILDQMIDGRIFLRSITIPEGLAIVEIASLWENKGFGSQDDFIRQAKSVAFDLLEKPATGWEGYLFPDTYKFPKNCSAEKLIEQMLRRFKEKFPEEWIKAGTSREFSMHEIVTLASLIEEEAKHDDERPMISSVFHNRLRSGMLLQCDPTVLYAKGLNRSENLSRDDLKMEHPYNTYMNSGLPPGPISNPGLASLEAACFPSSSSFHYFVLKENGRHEFTTILADHNRAVQHLRQLEKLK